MAKCKKYEEFGLDSLLQETRGGRNHAYKKELGRSYTRDAFYQLLKRHGWRNITPRPEHPRKADAQTIVASKNKVSIQEDK
ncbi:degenerate transposase [Streptococcus pneumoniae]|nr:degenerate transposase [Streptococcus pneumoniae]CWI26719.1 degenerate transposase [Streptococcus pneumoniae]SNK76506.1 degenerate transposase [Streptococcus pneumoniae]SNN79578.1 degenerate transposase [Streptococcus pneumoniae]SVF05882.1 degenerate transposase [Streptococcus pneumoniae]